jgi:hypothetical protein
MIDFQLDLFFVAPLSFSIPDKSLAQDPALRKRGVLRNAFAFPDCRR